MLGAVVAHTSDNPQEDAWNLPLTPHSMSPLSPTTAVVLLRTVSSPVIWISLLLSHKPENFI